MIKACVLLCVGLAVPIAANADRHLRFQGDFESGQVQNLESSIDGFRIRTLPNPQLGSKIEVVANGGADWTSKIDTLVSPGEIVPTNGSGVGEKVTPRRGRYFIRSALYKSKDYTQMNANGENKPRSGINVSGKGNKVDFDEEGYLGFSIYLPKNWEHETGVKDSRGSSQLLQVQSQGASWRLLALRVYVPPGETEAHWFLEHFLSDSSIRGGDRTEHDLGRVRHDLGKWTDFVLRYRFNPFSVRTNASSIAGGKDQVYAGNKGILQLWKSKGPIYADGNREMFLTSVNLENEPVGLVPHATEKIDWHFRVYKYGWHKNPTHVEGPVWVGFDEIRDGRVLADGTTYNDVHPAGLHCTDQCPANSWSPPKDSRPLPPIDIAVHN